LSLAEYAQHTPAPQINASSTPPQRERDEHGEQPDLRRQPGAEVGREKGVLDLVLGRGAQIIVEVVPVVVEVHEQVEQEREHPAKPDLGPAQMTRHRDRQGSRDVGHLEPAQAKHRHVEQDLERGRHEWRPGV
jgi:hypothetical protein